MARSSLSQTLARTSLPFGWYVFFGIVEPVSVLAGCVYATVFQDNFHAELVPTGYVEHIVRLAKGSGTAKAALVAHSVAATVGAPNAATRMALAQLGSCYFLIMLNSALMFYAIRRWAGQNPVAQERLLYFLFTVLGLADWTHILLTIHFLPAVQPASSDSALSHAVAGFAQKVWILATRPDAWNSLLFGNIVITFLLFCARAAWWVGIGRDRFFDGQLPDVPTKAKRS